MGIRVQCLSCMWRRWDKGYENCRMGTIPHKRLTEPCKVFDFCFDGVSKVRGRDNLLKLRVTADGTLNAVAFWFDLHLDSQASITSGALYGSLPQTSATKRQSQQHRGCCLWYDTVICWWLFKIAAGNCTGLAATTASYQ